jgi:hypothetical protein
MNEVSLLFISYFNRLKNQKIYFYNTGEFIFYQFSREFDRK